MLVKRESKYPISPIILNRHSSRAMSGEHLSEEELMTLFEAARWAPSCYNSQPWKFLYAKRGGKFWDIFFNLLVPFNQKWVKNASVLVVTLSAKNFEKNGKPAKTHSFDTGSAFENLALQGAISGWIVHGMGGFDYSKAKIDLEVPDDYEVEMMIAIGKKGSIDLLDEELKAQEPFSDRKPLADLVKEGSFSS